jgi:hypothetical protein
MIMYRGADEYPGSLLLCVSENGRFPHVSGVCSIFFIDVGSDSGKVSVYIVLYSVQSNTSSCY